MMAASKDNLGWLKHLAVRKAGKIAVLISIVLRAFETP